MADALLYFTADVLESFAADIPSVCPGKSVTAVLEAALLESLEDEEKELRSLHTLYRIGEALDSLSHTPKKGGVSSAYLTPSFPRSSSAVLTTQTMS